MVKIDDVRMFPIMMPLVSIPQNEDQKYNIIFMSENSDFISSYSSLNIRPAFVRRITAVPFKVPRLLATISNLVLYKAIGLIPTLDPKENVFIDTSRFFSLIKDTYGDNYRKPIILSKSIDYLTDCKIGENRKNILIYHINLNKPVPQYILNMKAIILYMMAKAGEGTFPFDQVILAIQSGSVKYTSIYSKNARPFAPGKILSIFKQLMGKEMEPEEPEESEEPIPQEETDQPVSDSKKWNIYSLISEVIEKG